MLIFVPIPKVFGTGLRGIPIRIGINPQKYSVCRIDYELYEFIAVQNILGKGYEAKRLIDLESPAF